MEVRSRTFAATTARCSVKAELLCRPCGASQTLKISTRLLARSKLPLSASQNSRQIGQNCSLLRNGVPESVLRPICRIGIRSRVNRFNATQGLGGVLQPVKIVGVSKINGGHTNPGATGARSDRKAAGIVSNWLCLPLTESVVRPRRGHATGNLAIGQLECRAQAEFWHPSLIR